MLPNNVILVFFFGKLVSVFISFLFSLCCFRKERGIENIEIQHFVAKKADLLFSHSWKTNEPTTTDANEEIDGKS